VQLVQAQELLLPPQLQLADIVGFLDGKGGKMFEKVCWMIGKTVDGGCGCDCYC
jgi:hypothetical protein